jgi:hypothetical protein
MIQICSTPQEAVDVNGGHWRGRFGAASPPPPPAFPNTNAANVGNFLVSVSFLQQQQECPDRESSSTSSSPPLPPLLPILNLQEDQEQPPASWKHGNNRIQLRPRFRHDGSTSDAVLQDLLARSAGIKRSAPPAPLLQTTAMTYEDEPAADPSFLILEEEQSEPIPSPNAISNIQGVVDAPLLPRYSTPSTSTPTTQPRLRLKSRNPIVRASFPELMMERTTPA